MVIEQEPARVSHRGRERRLNIMKKIVLFVSLTMVSVQVKAQVASPEILVGKSKAILDNCIIGSVANPLNDALTIAKLRAYCTCYGTAVLESISQSEFIEAGKTGKVSPEGAAKAQAAREKCNPTLQ